MPPARRVRSSPAWRRGSSSRDAPRRCVRGAAACARTGRRARTRCPCRSESEPRPATRRENTEILDQQQAELEGWLRFNDEDIALNRDGLLSRRQRSGLLWSAAWRLVL